MCPTFAQPLVDYEVQVVGADRSVDLAVYFVVIMSSIL